MKLQNPILVQDLAQQLGAELIQGNATHITGINEIHKVQTGDLSFVDHPKYYDKALQSLASVVLINSTDVKNTQNKTLLISKNPFKDYNLLVQQYYQPLPLNQAIHPLAKIGNNTFIAHGAVIGANVVIGDNCIIQSNVVIYPNAHIGNQVIIHANTTIGADAFYYKRTEDGYQKLRSCGTVIIGNAVEIGANCTIDKGVSGDTVIGNGCKLDNHVHIGHGTVLGEHVLIAAQTGVAGKVHIANNVILWGQVGVSKDLTIGENAVVLAQSGVSKTLEPAKTYFGSPAREAKQMMRTMANWNLIPTMWEKLKQL